MGKALWIVGFVPDEDHHKLLGWKLVGVYSEESKAELACRDRRNFYAQVLLDSPISSLVMCWPTQARPSLVQRRRRKN